VVFRVPSSLSTSPLDSHGTVRQPPWPLFGRPHGNVLSADRQHLGRSGHSPGIFAGRPSVAEMRPAPVVRSCHYSEIVQKIPRLSTRISVRCDTVAPPSGWNPQSMTRGEDIHERSQKHTSGYGPEKDLPVTKTRTALSTFAIATLLATPLLGQFAYVTNSGSNSPLWALVPSATRRGDVPSCRATQISACPERFEVKATCLPSGEKLGKAHSGSTAKTPGPARAAEGSHAAFWIVGS